MLWKTDKPSHRHILHTLLFCFAAFVLAGCASSPWTDPLKDTEADAIAHQVDALAARDAACGRTLEGDLVLFYQSPLGKKALEGFLQFSMPSSYKFVVSNPFGQPVLIVAGNQDYFEAINTLTKQFLTENLASFGLRNDIPSHFLKSDWSSLLTGRMQLSSRSIIDIRNDREARGVWLTFQNKQQAGVSHLLFDREKEIFLVYILEDGNGKKIAEITYGKRMPADTCHQPLEINIAGLDYGTEIHITLDNVILSEQKKTYRLRPPAGYTRQYKP